MNNPKALKGTCGLRWITRCAWGLALSMPLFAQQSPWGIAAGKLADEFTGPIARGLVLVGIVVGGISLIFTESGGRRTIGNIVFGGSLCLGAAQFVTWLFT